MTRSRIEGLLNAFPKLIKGNDQHTFVETDAVRYVYQPLDELYIVLITNKNSNILMDIDTLHLFSSLVSEYCRSHDEKEIMKQRFELVLVFDEVISLGYRENINLGQIKTISQMESADERIQAEIQKNKELEAKEELKRRAALMDLKKWEQNKKGGMGMPDMGGYTSSASMSFSQPPSQPSIPTSYSAPVQERSSFSNNSSSSIGMGRGMQLGKKSLQTSLLESIKKDEGVHEPPAMSPIEPSKPEQVTEEGIHLVIEEKLSALANRDGGLISMEVNGSMLLKVNDPNAAQAVIKVTPNQDPSVQFKTHPKVDKNSWNSAFVIESSRPFPVGQGLGILKWRYSGREESKLPLLVNCWPSPTNQGSCEVTVEYDLQTDSELSNVSIVLPFNGPNPPEVSQPEQGSFYIDRSQRTLIWQIPSINSTNSSGLLEFTVDTDDSNTLYPIKIHFSASKSITNFNVESVKNGQHGDSPFSVQTLVVSDGYEIA